MSQAECLLQLLQLITVATSQAELMADPQAFACPLLSTKEDDGKAVASMAGDKSDDVNSSSSDEDNDESVCSVRILLVLTHVRTLRKTVFCRYWHWRDCLISWSIMAWNVATFTSTCTDW